MQCHTNQFYTGLLEYEIQDLALIFKMNVTDTQLTEWKVQNE